MRPALLILLALASCAPSGKRGFGGGPDGPSFGGTLSGDLRILAELDPASSDPVEGGLGLFSVTVRNASKRFVILRDLSLADGTPILTWENPPPRALAYDPAADEFRAESGPRSTGEAVQIGLLLPGEAIVFRPKVRLLDMPRRYRLNYLGYSSTELAQNVYFETPGADGLRYRRMAAVDIAGLVPASAVEATHRSVVFPHARSPLEQPLAADLALEAPVPPRRFRLVDALRKASIAPADVVESTFCLYLEGWPVRTRRGAWLVTPRATTPLPRITRFELCFFYLDQIEPQLPVQFEFTGSLDVRFPGRRIDALPGAKDRTRKLAFIPREETPAFLKEVADKGLEIDVRAEGRLISLVLRSAAVASTPTVSWDDARKKAGLEPKDVIEHVWSDALGAWAVRTRSGGWYVSERGGGALPPVEWFAYFFRTLDEQAAAGEVAFVIPAEEADAFPMAPGGRVKRGDLPRFLATIQERGLKIDVAPPSEPTAFRLRR